MNKNNWHRKNAECYEGHCKYDNEQCEECGSCLSPMELNSHDLDCKTGERYMARLHWVLSSYDDPKNWVRYKNRSRDVA